MGMAAVDNSKPSPIDPELLTRVVREVIAACPRVWRINLAERINGQTESKTNRTAASIDDRVITAGKISRLPATTAELFVAAAAVVTPAARDEARRRGISINRGAKLATKEQYTTCTAGNRRFRRPERELRRLLNSYPAEASRPAEQESSSATRRHESCMTRSLGIVRSR